MMKATNVIVVVLLDTSIHVLSVIWLSRSHLIHLHFAFRLCPPMLLLYLVFSRPSAQQPTLPPLPHTLLQ